MAAADDTSAAIDAALAAANAEKTICGGALLDATIELLSSAKTVFEAHESSEDHVS